MTLPVVLRRSARAEFDAAADWYEHSRPGLGPEFTAAVERVFGRIVGQPSFYPRVFKHVREALVSGYPYCVYYFEESDRIVVLAVFHTSRDPAVWQGRK